MLSKILAFLQGRSTKWPAFRKENMEKTCRACGGARKLELHHIQPVHIYPELELVPANVITLCMGPHRCHFEVGHLCNWDNWNTNVVADAAAELKVQRGKHASK